jgi:hypothetical protein
MKATQEDIAVEFWSRFARPSLPPRLLGLIEVAFSPQNLSPH